MKSDNLKNLPFVLFFVVAIGVWVWFMIGTTRTPYCDLVVEDNITYEAFSARVQGEECEKLKQNCQNFTNCEMVKYFGNGFDEEKTEACWCRVENNG